MPVYQGRAALHILDSRSNREKQGGFQQQHNNSIRHFPTENLWDAAYVAATRLTWVLAFIYATVISPPHFATETPGDTHHENPLQSRSGYDYVCGLLLLGNDCHEPHVPTGLGNAEVLTNRQGRE